MEIEELLRILVGATDFFSKIGSVYDIDETKRTCSVKLRNADADLHGVRLQSQIDLKTGVLYIPTENSDVIIGFLDEDEAFISATSKIDKVELITEKGIDLNGNADGGLIQIVKLTDKLNKLTADFNKLVTKFNAHTHITTAVNPATASPGIISPTVTPAEPTAIFKKSDYENETVNHG